MMYRTSPYYYENRQENRKVVFSSNKRCKMRQKGRSCHFSIEIRIQVQITVCKKFLNIDYSDFLNFFHFIPIIMNWNIMNWKKIKINYTTHKYRLDKIPFRKGVILDDRNKISGRRYVHRKEIYIVVKPMHLSLRSECKRYS